MAESLSDKAKQLAADLWKMFAKKRAPGKAPWPPGVDVRMHCDDPGCTWLELRPGASLPAPLYLKYAAEAMRRASKQSARPCMN